MRQPESQRGRQQTLFRISAIRWVDIANTVAPDKRADFGSNLLNHPGGLDARYAGQRECFVETRPHIGVVKIHGNGSMANPQLTGARLADLYAFPQELFRS